MPIHKSYDSKGYYYQWGNHGKKYYFNKDCSSCKKRAYNKAKKQMIAIYASGWRES